MKILLDTHMILWAIANDPRLSEKEVEMIKDSHNTIFCSVVSFWEIQIKHILYPSKMPSLETVIKYCALAGFETIKINTLEILNLSSLKFRNGKTEKEHKDPFDRLLISQAKTYGMSLLTTDSVLKGYNESCILCN